MDSLITLKAKYFHIMFDYNLLKLKLIILLLSILGRDYYFFINYKIFCHSSVLIMIKNLKSQIKSKIKIQVVNFFNKA